MLVFSALSARSQTVITFDDIAAPADGAFITNGYQSLNWSNFGVGNAVLHSNINGVSGYNYGMVSPSNIAFNADGTPAEIDSPGTNFTFLSAYFTGAWRSNLNIEIQGYRDTNLIYDETLVVSATNTTFFNLDYSDIDRLAFNSFGGQYAGFSSDGEEFVMDNFMFDFIPEPSSLLLTAMAAMCLLAFVRRRRR
jgi:hypothetical protein